MKISYNWLAELVTLTLNPKELAERLTMAGLAVEAIERIGDDYILDFDLTSNRPDALSHLGIAREAALLCGAPLIPRVFPALCFLSLSWLSCVCTRIGAPLDSRQLRSINAKDDRR